MINSVKVFGFGGAACSFRRINRTDLYKIDTDGICPAATLVNYPMKKKKY